MQQLPILISEILNMKVIVKTAGKHRVGHHGCIGSAFYWPRRQYPLTDWLEHTKRGLLSERQHFQLASSKVHKTEQISLKISALRI